MATAKGANKKLEGLIADLQSLDEKKFNAAMEELKIKGNNSIIAILADLYPRCSVKQKSAIVALLSDVKNEDAQDIIVETILDSKDEETRVALLSTIWNSTVDYSEFLNEFVRIAIKGSFLEAIECHTIIDNLEGPFDESVVMDSKIMIQENIKAIVKDEQKSVLLSDILLKLEEFDRNIES